MKERWLFLALVVLTLVPVWGVARVPTMDGPSHLYNAWLIGQLARPGGDPWLGQAYEMDWRPLPNWTGHAALALLMVPFSPATAEKVLISGYVVLFLAGARYLAGAVDPQRRWLALLAFPFVFNQGFQLGFYNFGLSLGLFLFALGYWWRRRASPDLRFALGINGLLFLCYFSHILSTLLALGAIGVLWLVSLRAATWRRHLLHVPILAPQAILPLWYLSGHHAAVASSAAPQALWLYFRRIGMLFTFSEKQLLFGSLLAALFALLALATLLGRARASGWRLRPREEDGFLLLAVLMTVLYFVSPDGVSAGTLIQIRLSLYPWLLLLPWLSPRLGRPAQAALVAVLALAAAGNAAAHLRWHRIVDRDVEACLGTARAIEPRTRVLPIFFDRRASIGAFELLTHAFSRVAVDKELLDWSNYEAASNEFPVRFRDGLQRPDLYTVVALPERLRIHRFRHQLDYVFCWKMPPSFPQATRLRKSFTLVARTGPGRIFEHRARVQARRADRGRASSSACRSRPAPALAAAGRTRIIQPLGGLANAPSTRPTDSRRSHGTLARHAPALRLLPACGVRHRRPHRR